MAPRPKVAPKNCLWSDWTWESCTATCGGGIQNGTRTVAQPAENGGSECTGPSTSTQSCNSEKCPGPRGKGRAQGIPDAKIVLLGEEYDGSGKWIDSDSGMECTLGSATTYDKATSSFHFDYSPSSVITCPYDISPSKQRDLTIEVVFKFDDDFNGGRTQGWMVGSTGWWPRALIVSDDRVGGYGQAIGGGYNSYMQTPSNGMWHHGIATFRQGVSQGSFVTLDGYVGSKQRANSGNGQSTFTIGGLTISNHGIKGSIRAVFIYETYMDEDTARLAYKDAVENLELLPDPCPEGYTLKAGDVPGWGTISGRHRAATVEDCTAICDQNDRCCSVEWSPTEKYCNLNKECKPTARLYKDYLLCSNGD